MKVAIINKSENTGGAAVVSRRLMEALRQQGVDARMIVVEKSSNHNRREYENSINSTNVKCQVVSVNDSFFRKINSKYKFLIERLKIFIANGFNRSSLFKIDTGEEGIPLWKNPFVKEADAILINWINQGMLSLKGFKRILQLGKPVIWTMHDMWEMTGICHHAGKCNHFTKECGDCWLLGLHSSPDDLSHKIWLRKNKIYTDKVLMKKMAFVAVSRWLKEKAMESGLLKCQRVEVIHNAFDLKDRESIANNGHPGERETHSQNKNRIRILFGAARLDDPIKGLMTLKAAAELLKKEYPEISERLEIAMFGSIRNAKLLDGFSLPLIHLGILKTEEEVREAYENSEIVVSASSYETLPGTLVEAQAFGCIPVSFNQGGQSDIIENGITGFITQYSSEPGQRASNLAEGILKAVEVIDKPEKRKEMLRDMRESVYNKFSFSGIAGQYIDLIESLSAKS